MMLKEKTQYLLAGGIVLLIFSIPFILTRPAFTKTLDFSNSGQIGDTVGGLTAPLINLLGAVLVYLSFQQQIKANEIQRKSLTEEIKRNESERKYNSIMLDINNLRADINDFRYAKGATTYYGSAGLHEFRKYCIASDKAKLENLIAVPVFHSFYFLIASTDTILKNIINSELSDVDKKDLKEKLIYLFSSKIAHDSVPIIMNFIDKKVKNQFIDMLYPTIIKLGEYINNSGI